MSVFTRTDSINIAKIAEIRLVSNSTKKVKYEITFELKEIATVLHNVTNVEIYIDTTIDNDVLTPFVEMLTRDRLNFKTPAQYINYINNIQNANEQIKEILELERSDIFNYKLVTRFDPRESIDNGRERQIIADRLERQRTDAGGADPADINLIDVNTVIIKKDFTVEQDDIKKGFFQLKCIVCAPQDPPHNLVHTHQYIITKVDHDLLAKMFRTDLPAPSINVTRSTAYGKNQFQVSFSERQEPHDKFPFVKGIKVLRRQLDDTNNPINDFVLLKEIMFDEGSETHDGIFMALTYNFVDMSVNNFKTQQYRVIPMNAQGESGTRFTDVIAEHLISPDNTIKREVQQLGSNVLLDAIQSQTTKEVIISVSDIALGIESAVLKRRNVSIHEKQHKILEVKKINQDSSVSFTDGSVQTNMTYEYVVDLKDVRDNTVSSDHVFLIKVLPESQKKNIQTEIKNVRKIDGGNRFDIVATNLEQPTAASQLASKIKTAILSRGSESDQSSGKSIKEVYADILKQSEMTENVGFLPIYKVSRINTTTHELEMSKFIEGSTYIETDKLNDSHGYRYKVETAIVDVDKMIKGISNPKLFETIGNAEKEMGTIPATNSTMAESDILDKSLGIHQTAVQFDAKQSTVSISNLYLNRINRKNISIKWTALDMQHMLDHVIIERKCDKFDFEQIGKTTETFFVDVITPELASSNFEYRITPILRNGTAGLAVAAVVPENVTVAPVAPMAQRSKTKVKSTISPTTIKLKDAKKLEMRRGQRNEKI